MALISFQQVMNLPEFSQAKILGGMKGNVRSIRFGHVIDLPNVYEWIDYGELIFMTGVGLSDVESDLIKIIRGIDAKNGAGLVLEIGPYINEVPQSVIELSDVLKVPLITLPFQVRINDIMTSIYMMYYETSVGNESIEKLMRRLLYFEYDKSFEDIALHLGYSHQSTYVAAVLQMDHMIENYSRQEFLYTLTNCISGVLRNECKFFGFDDSGYYIVMLPVEAQSSRMDILQLIQKLQNKLTKQHKELTVSAGIGNKYNKLKDFKKSVTEAKNAIRLLRACKRENAVRFYSDIGIYRLFFRMTDYDELLQLLRYHLGELMDYDRENGTDLVNTLDVYLKNSRSISISAEQLFVHRNTLKYRINKAQELLNINLEDANICFNLILAFKIKRFLYDVGEAV